MNIEVFHDDGAIDVSVIDEFEKSIGYKFPSTYRNLISRHNSLHPENCDFDFFDNSLGRTASRDVTFLGYGTEVLSSSNIANAQWHDIYGRDHVVVFGRTAGGDYVCFDYRENPTTDNPPVVVMLHDYFDDNDNKMFICLVADNFDQFIDSLYSVDGDDE